MMATHWDLVRHLLYCPTMILGSLFFANLQGVNSGLRAILLKFLELSLDLPNRSDDILARAEQASKKISHILQTRIQTDARSLEWVKQWLGSYKNPRLGTITLRQAARGGFELDAGEWASSIGAHVSVSGERAIF